MTSDAKHQYHVIKGEANAMGGNKKAHERQSGADL
jgi:hypothetical protein